MARKRKNGEGTFGKQTVNGIEYFYYKSPEGKFTRARTNKELLEKIEKKKQEEKKPCVDRKLTFYDYCTEFWLPSKKVTVEPTTYDCYETMLNGMLKPYHLANMQIPNLNPRHIQTYINELSEKYSHASIKKMWAILKMILKYGQASQELPVDFMQIQTLVNIPKESACAVETKEIPFLSEQELDMFVKEAQSDIYGINAMALIFIAYTGLRVSECIALKWLNVNLEDKYILVTESAAKIKNRGNTSTNKEVAIDKAPKSKAGNRKIPLSKQTIAVLEKLPHNSDYVFCNKQGNKLDRRNINRTLKAITSRTDINKDFTVHTLRHTYGSILLRNGVDIKVVSELLGHSQISTTYNIYIGILEEDKAADVERVFNSF